jgi:hypothetical protein
MRYLALAVLVLAACACGESSPGGPDETDSRLTILEATPAADSAIAVPPQYAYIVPGGVVIPPGSGLISVRLTMTAAHEVPWARLNVYLLTGDTASEYCGENGPDAPTWQFLPAGWTSTYTVTGFRVYRLPCEVTGIRAMLHMRNNGLIAPPTPTETIAEATLTRHLVINR